VGHCSKLEITIQVFRVPLRKLTAAFHVKCFKCGTSLHFHIPYKVLPPRSAYD